MPSNFNIEIKDKELKNILTREIEKKKAEFRETVNKTAIFAKQKIAETLPKRSGNLRNSYRISSISGLAKRVASISAYADMVEDGGIRPEILPKRTKRLTIPLNDSVLTPTRTKIKQSSLNKLFDRVGITKNNKLYSKVKGSSPYEQMSLVGIILAKRAKAVKIKGSHNLANKVVPATDMFFKNAVDKVIKGTL